MDGSRYILLEVLKEQCLRSTGYSWTLLAAAVGISEGTQKVYSDLKGYAWNCSADWAPKYAIWQVAALSVSRPDLLKSLLAAWESEPYIDDFERCSEWLYVANRAARNFFRCYELNLTSTAWKWSDFSDRSLIPDDLISRPLTDRFLSYADIQKSVNAGGAALRALQTQLVDIDSSVFEYYSMNIKSTDSFVLAFLILLSKQKGFDKEIWIQRLLDVLHSIKDPIDLLYISGGLLNTNWQVPVWHV